MPSLPIITPGNYAVPNAIGFSDDADGTLTLVAASRPLPVQTIKPTLPPPLLGTTETTEMIGPFTPATGAPILLALSGTWQGSVNVMRSYDGGANKLGLTMGGTAWARFTSNVCETVWEEIEEGAQLYLSITLTSGSLTYRLAQ